MMATRERLPRWLPRWTLIALATAATLFSLGVVLGVVRSYADLIGIFVLGWLLAFILNPLCRFLNRPRGRRLLPWGIAVLLVYLLLVLVILGAILWAVPLVVEQLQRLVSSLPEIAANVDATMDNLRAQVGLPPEDVPESGQPNLTVVLSGLLNTAVANLAGLVAGAASIVTNMILVLVFALYLNLGGPILGARLVRMLPRGWRDEARLFNRELNRAFGGFLRGQVIYAALSGVIALVVMLVFQTPFAGLAAIATFLLSLIPLLGSFLGIIPPMLAGFLVSTQTGILILVILGGIQLVLTNAIMPKIFGSSIQLEPILVFVAIVVGIRLAGIWGAVFAIPLTALGIAMAQHARRRRAILAASRT